jgi:DNA polymerase I-like protein with 3'-5' exonuclease and polymerase domains
MSKFGGENDQQELLDDIRKADFIVAHNAKFELGWLRRCGADLRDLLVYDTMLAEWVLLGNQKEKGISLQASCARHLLSGKLDLVGEQIKLGVNPENIPKDWLLEYCHMDVDITEALFLSQRRALSDRKQLHLVYQRGLVCACLADVEPRGLCLDPERVKEEYDKTLLEYNTTKEKLETYGSINWRSRKQVAELLYDSLSFPIPCDRRGNPLTTAGGDRPTSQSVLASLVPRNAQQREFLELFKQVAHLNAKLSKSLEFYKGVVEKHDGIFLGILNQGSTATHRLSSSGRAIILSEKGAAKETKKGIQLQNQAREFKRLFRAKREGWLIFEADGSGLEFRVAADLGHDEVAYDEILNGADVHSITAKTLTDAGEPTSRQDAKSRTFRPLYGGSSGTKAEQAYCKFFQQKYKGIFETQTGWTYEVLKSKEGELITPYGMRFYWPGTKVTRSGFIENTTSIFNYPVQGLATAEIIPLTLLAFWHKTKDLRCELVNTIHDSIIAEVHPDDLDEVAKIAEVCFTTDVYKLLKDLYNYNFSVPLGVEWKAGSHWGQGQGHKSQVTPNNE